MINHPHRSKKARKQEPKITVPAFKGFDKNLVCREFKYEIGKSYTFTGSPVICQSGFHACDMPLDAWTYYGPVTSRYCSVELSGAMAQNDEKDSKIAAAEITIKAELKLPEIIRAAVAWILERAKTNTATGDSGHAAATGNSGHAAATGNSGHAAATGDYGHAAATGDSGHAAATGYSGHAAATGYSGHAAATGYSGHAAVKGKNAIAAALAKNGSACAEDGGAIMLAAYDDNWNLLAVFSSKVGENGIEAGKTYTLGADGKPIEKELCLSGFHP